jgi:hypothetical protein
MQNILIVTAIFFLAFGDGWAGGGIAEEYVPELSSFGLDLEKEAEIEENLNGFINAIRNAPQTISHFAQQLTSHGLSMEQLKALFDARRLNWELAAQHLYESARTQAKMLQGMGGSCFSQEAIEALKTILTRDFLFRQFENLQTLSWSAVEEKKEESVTHVMGEIATLDGVKEHIWDQNTLVILAIDGVLLDGDPSKLKLINPNTVQILSDLKAQGATVWGYSSKSIADLQGVVYQIHQHEIFFTNPGKKKYTDGLKGKRGFDSGIVFANGYKHIIPVVQNMFSIKPPFFPTFSKVVIVSDKDVVVEHMNQQTSSMPMNTVVLHFTGIADLTELKKFEEN